MAFERAQAATIRPSQRQPTRAIEFSSSNAAACRGSLRRRQERFDAAAVISCASAPKSWRPDAGRLPMKSQLVSGAPDAQIYVVILNSGEEAFAALTKFANEAKLTAASLTAIGAFEKATIGWFDFNAKRYRKIEVGEQCEVLSAIGDVAVGDDGKASLHIHIVLGLSDGSTRGGHLLAGTVRPTLEVVLTEVPSKLRRTRRPDLGIALIDIGAK
jgi:predicted DNA-binding protein with PD1-like motif